MAKYLIFSLLLACQVLGHAQERFTIIREAENYGGKTELTRFLKQEMVYPETCLDSMIGGKVTWAFIVDLDGKLSNFKQIGNPNPELAMEAYRLIHLLKWKPAEIEGTPVPSEKDFIIHFDPKKYKSIRKKRGYAKVEYPYQPFDTTFTIYEKADQLAKFNMNNQDLNSFLAKNIRYPNEAYRNEIKGTVLVSFVIEPTGMVTNVHVEKHVGGGCSEEAARLVSLTKWTPGMKNGVAVRTRMTLPIIFDRSITMTDGLNREQRLN